MFHALLIITLFLLASLHVCLLTLRLSIYLKPLCHFFRSLPILTDVLKFQPTPVYFNPLRLLNLTKVSNPSVY